MEDPRERVPVALERQRERTVEALCTHYARDHLTVEDFEGRLDRAYSATSGGELVALVRDLPELPPEEQLPAPARAAPHEVDERGLQLAVMSGSERRGEWTPPRRLYTVALMGGAGLDFREARFGPGVTEVTILACMGGVEVLVPPGLAVESSGLPLMGGFDGLDQAGSDPSPDAPRLRIRGLALMGGIEISQRLPGESARDARHRLKRKRRGRIRGETSAEEE